MASSPQQNPAVLTTLVEEKHFDIRLERSGHLLKEAIEHSIGHPMVELAHGMWTARYSVGRFYDEEITVRALPSDQGTTVEVRIEHHARPLAASLFALGVITGSLLIVPLIYAIMVQQARNRENARTRLIRMHKVWTELAATVGAPLKAGYRDRPERTKVRVETEDAEEGEQEVDEERAKRAS